MIASSPRAQAPRPHMLLSWLLCCRCILLRFSESNLASLWPTLLHEIRRLLALWLQVPAVSSSVWDSAVTACFDVLECLWTTAPDSWSFQAWAFRSMLSPIAALSSDMGARANAILALATSNIMLLDHSLQKRAIEKLNLEAERCLLVENGPDLRLDLQK